MSIRSKLCGWRPTALLLAMAPFAAVVADPVDQACLDCHRDASRGAVPIIEGQHYDYLRTQLLRFAENHRHGFPMNALAAGLDATRAEVLAKALSARDWPTTGSALPNKPLGAEAGDGAAEPAADPEASIDTAQLAALDCAACHGADYRGGGSIPRLAGQRQDYLQRQIEGFGQAQRHHPPVAGGARMYMIDAGEAQAIAVALSRLR